MALSEITELRTRCDLLRSLHRPGDPLLRRFVAARLLSVVATSLLFRLVVDADAF